MKASDFIEHPKVQELLAQATAELSSKVFSDVTDSEGNQYVDLVMEGGGVLGVALVGYTFAMEYFGLRFRSTGGTSAGAINAIFIQAMGTPSQARSKKMIEHVANMPMASFQDGGADGKFFVKSWLSNNRLLRISILAVFDDLFKHLGLNPGDKFLKWVKKILKQQGVETWAALKAQMHTLPHQVTYQDEQGEHHPVSAESFAPSLRVVAAELTTTTKVVLPERDGDLFYDDVTQASPADFARASMSVPFFFHPFRIADIPTYTADKWLSRHRYNGDIPQQAVFVDGGIVSNFPINLFHVTGSKPRVPTFGVKLGVNKSQMKDIDGVLAMTGAMIDVMRHDADEEFLTQNPDFNQLVKHIDTGEHHWLNFNLKDEDKIDLFIRGVSAALAFLKHFDWQAYKAIR